MKSNKQIMAAVRRGTINQGLINSVGQGMQCTIIATMALLALFLNGSTIETWNSEVSSYTILY